MKRWTFSTDTIEFANRNDEWREAMSRINLPVESIYDESNLYGSISSVELSNGLRVNRVASTPQTLAGEYKHATSAVWVSTLIDGSASFIVDKSEFVLNPGDICYGRAGRIDARLEYHTPFSQLSIKVPPAILDPRLINPTPIAPGCIRANTNTARIFSDMLLALADSFEEMPELDWRPIELSLTQFLVTSVFAKRDPRALWGTEAKQAAQLNRICETIDSCLDDPSLTLAQIADMEGVSMRYLQKLFATSDTTFSSYIRLRRLEQCREDLINASGNDELSITEICFRRGFSSSAHFSRSFRDVYGVSPREFRRSAMLSQPVH